MVDEREGENRKVRDEQRCVGFSMYGDSVQTLVDKKAMQNQEGYEKISKTKEYIHEVPSKRIRVVRMDAADNLIFKVVSRKGRE